MSVNVQRTEQTERKHPWRTIFAALAVLLPALCALRLLPTAQTPSAAEAHIASLADGALFDSSVAENGAYALLSDTADTRATLAVYDADGTLVFRHRSETAFLNTCALAPNAQTVAVTALGLQDGAVTATLRLYSTVDDTAPVTWQLDGLPYACEFLSDDTLRVSADTGQYYYNTDGTSLPRSSQATGGIP